jgi:hypothetical protein
MYNVLVKDLVHNRLTDYMWDLQIAQIQEEHWKKCPRTQIQKRGIVYAADIDREISSLEELGAWWEANCPADQKVYLLILQSIILPQLLLKTKELKEVADQSAINCLQRVTERANK